MIAQFLGDEFEWEQKRSCAPPRRMVGRLVVFEPRAAEIREAMFGSGEQSTQQSQHAAVRHHEDASTAVERDDVGERGHGPGLRRLGGLESRWSSIGFEPSGPLGLNFLTGEPLPFTGVVLPPARVDTTMFAAHHFGDEISRHRRPFQVTRDHEIERWAFRSEKGTGLACLQPTESGERRIGLPLPPAEGVPFTLSMTDHEDPSDAVRNIGRVGTGHGRPRYPRYARHVVTVRLFAQAREAAGTSRDVLPGSTVEDVVHAAGQKYGERFVALLPTCRIWLNGEEVPPTTPVTDKDEVAVLPPVSGGCR